MLNFFQGKANRLFFFFFLFLDSMNFVTDGITEFSKSLGLLEVQILYSLVKLYLVLHDPMQHSRLPCPSPFPRGCSNSCLISWPKYWSFSFSTSPSNDYSGLISFRIDRLDLLAVQGTLKSSPPPQFKSINSSTLSFLYGPTLTSIHDYWKNHRFDQKDHCWQSNVSDF